jgi:regulator of nucleoside diphosphate kinase
MLMTNPEIVISSPEKHQLTRLAEAALDSTPEIADALLIELERAETVEAPRLPENVVTMNSAVFLETEEGKRRWIKLVFPGEADIDSGRISILTPIGAALIGLSIGQSMEWRARDGRSHQLKVLDVRPPGSAK